ncbi:hypothetical protein DV515_00008708 [Chloebia gouldiae]|uniref:Uncharacterized protein n=1 Tax=Chloebia gouldiae TaxID=44316 RepID=A0A3L8SFN9_CHLGU|nr:hypothetical protein DV515_00008708 [Chloebia gouldiae]
MHSLASSSGGERDMSHCPGHVLLMRLRLNCSVASPHRREDRQEEVTTFSKAQWADTVLEEEDRDSLSPSTLPMLAYSTDGGHP